MKKFSLMFAVISLLLFGTATLAHAARVQIYDGSVKDILNDIKETENYMSNIDSKIRGTHYFTGKDGFRYCESHFGDNDQNRLVFRLNNNGAVSSAWVICRVYTLAGELDYDSAKIEGMLFGGILLNIGMSKNEYDKLSGEIGSWLNNPPAWGKRVNETFSVWCSKSNRYIDVNLSSGDSYDFLNYYISAHT